MTHAEISPAPPLDAGNITETAIQFAAKDGYPLSGLNISGPSPKAGMMVTAGTGFPMTYYRPFARHAAARGYAVYLYDCRGIAASAPDDLAAMQMDYTDWGRYDMPAILDRMASDRPTLPLVHVGHSVGGHFAGFMDNHEKLSAQAFVCVGSGYWGGHFWWYRPLVLWFWHGHGARSLKQRGYVARGNGWTGAPLPRGVFETWKRWCAKRRYFIEELESDLKPHHFDEITSPIRSYVYSDDPVANPKAAQLMLDLYAAAPKDMVIRAPADHGLKQIGHNGPFAKTKLSASDEILDWLDRQL